MFSNFAPQTRIPGEPPNGFLALAEFDKPENGGNDDGAIDEKDAVFGRLRLWRDANHNGVVDPGELATPVSVGISGFNLDYHRSRSADQYGNSFRYRAKVVHSNRSDVARWAYDVYLVRAE